MAAKTAGRKQNRKTQRGRSQQDVNPKDYAVEKRPFEVFRDEWMLLVQPGQFVHKEKKQWVPDHEPIRYNFGNEITSIDWTEGESGRAGNITVNYGPDEDLRERTIRIEEGYLFVLNWRNGPGTGWRELWRMRCMSPSINASAQECSFELQDDLAYLKLSQDDFKYGKSKKHPGGMTTGAIIRDICRRFHQPVGQMPKMKVRVKDFKLTGTPYDAILQAVQREVGDSGRKLVIRSIKGRLCIVPLKPSEHAYVLGPAIIDATYSRSLQPNFATVLRVSGTLGKDKKKKKKKALVTVKSLAAIKKYGYILQSATPPERAHSRSKFRHFGRNELQRRAMPTKEYEIVHPGIPFLKRWDALKTTLRVYGPAREDLVSNQIIWVTEVTHTVAPGDYSMDVTVQFTDPFFDTSDDAKTRRKCASAKKRGRKGSFACHKLKKKHKKDKNSKHRGDKGKGKKK